MKKINIYLTFIVLILVFTFTVGCTENQEEISLIEYESIFPDHDPLGEGIGIYPGRVVWSYDNRAVDWNGEGYWWKINNFNAPIIEEMFKTSINELTGFSNVKESWDALFSYNNQRNGRSGSYQKGQKISIKVNINGSAVNDNDTSGNTNLAYTNPVLLKILLESLVNEGEVEAKDITVYDVSRLFPEYLVEYCTEGNLKDIQFVGRNNAVPDLNSPIEWSYDFETVTSYLPTCVTEADYLINFADLKGHSYGITLTGKNLFGSFINDSELRPPEYANLHQFLTDAEMGAYSPITDLMAHHDIYSKTFLYLFDALICAPSEGKEISLENSTWMQSPFDGGFTSSVIVSQDPVAIDSVGADILVHEPTIQETNSITGKNAAEENYLHEASQLADTPSGIIYQEAEITSLGVHEHWNNSEEKLYSINLGGEEGIELIYIDLSKDDE